MSKNFSKVSKIVFLVLILLLIYFPLFIIALQSFNIDSSGNTFGGFTIDWYFEMLEDDDLMASIYTSVSIAVISTIISTVLGTITAIGIKSLNKKRQRKMIFLNNIPIINADIVTGIFLLLVFNLIATILGINYILGYTTLLISHVLFSTPYVILCVLPKLNDIDDNLFDAALDLGCRPYYALRKIIIPSIKSGILAGMFFAFTMSIDDFVISYFVSGATVENFSIWLYGSLRITKNHPWPKACAYNTIIMVITIICLIAYNIFTKKKGRKQ